MGTQCATSGDTVPAEITSTEMLFYESSCTFNSVDLIGDAGMSWRVSVECSGEGYTWPVDYIFALNEVDQGQVMTFVDLTDGYTWMADFCG